MEVDLARLDRIEKKLDLLLQAFEDLKASALKARARKKKEKLPPPTAEEDLANRGRFTSLYERWMDGKEVEVHDELNAMEPEHLRRFADANNLNVTAKMSKQRTLELISARFREKRQLHKPPVERGGATE